MNDRVPLQPKRITDVYFNLLKCKRIGCDIPDQIQSTAGWMDGWMDGCIGCSLAVLVTMLMMMLMIIIVAARTTPSHQQRPEGSGCACQMQASRKKKMSSQVTQARDLPALCPAPKGRFEVPGTMQRPLGVTLDVGVDPGMRSKGPTQVESQNWPTEDLGGSVQPGLRRLHWPGWAQRGLVESSGPEPRAPSR